MADNTGNWGPAVVPGRGYRDQNYGHIPHQFEPERESEPEPPVPPDKKTNVWLLVGIVGLVLIAVLAGLGVVFRGKIMLATGLDSGVRACHAMAENKTVAKAADADSVVVGENFKDARKMFRSSNDEEIRTYGTAMVDALWQVIGAGGKTPDALTILSSYQDVARAYAGLSGACGKYGYTLPPMADLAQG